MSVGDKENGEDASVSIAEGSIEGVVYREGKGRLVEDCAGLEAGDSLRFFEGMAYVQPVTYQQHRVGVLTVL